VVRIIALKGFHCGSKLYIRSQKFASECGTVIQKDWVDDLWNQVKFRKEAAGS
jgi:hypothetical protein